MYYFSTLALTLNEPEEEVAPTDSRCRPDQRLMEDGHWDEANAEKQRLEEKQRSSRREREREAVKSPEEGKINSVCFVSDASDCSVRVFASLFYPSAVAVQSNNDPASKSKYSNCAPVWSALWRCFMFSFMLYHNFFSTRWKDSFWRKQVSLSSFVMLLRCFVQHFSRKRMLQMLQTALNQANTCRWCAFWILVDSHIFFTPMFSWQRGFSPSNSCFMQVALYNNLFLFLSSCLGLYLVFMYFQLLMDHRCTLTNASILTWWIASSMKSGFNSETDFRIWCWCIS